MALRYASLPVCLFAIGGCSAGEQSPPADIPRIVRSLDEIRGEWDIANFDGYEPTRLHGGIRRAFVDVRKDGLSYAIECNYSGMTASIDRNGILRDDSKEGQFTTLMACDPATAKREGKFYSLFRSDPSVAWTREGKLRLSNGESELLLERPAVRRLANVPSLSDLQGRWVAQTANRIERGGYSGWGFEGKSVLTIKENTISYDGCGGASFTFAYKEEGRFANVVEQGRASCSNTPGLSLLRVLREHPLVERSYGDSITLTSGDYSIVLQSEATQIQAHRNQPPLPDGRQVPAAPPPPPP